MRAYTLELSEEARAALARARDRDPRPYFRERGAALVKVAAGRSARQVALAGLGKRRKPETVRARLAAYRAGGLAGLAHAPRGHRGLPPPARGGVGGDGAAAA
jgi:hypothetical protein